MELVSVIVPVYNDECYLESCLESVASQSYKNIEVILVDDGSTDSSGKICDDYCLRDSRFRVFHQKNKGVSEARNVALRNAGGEWICFLDGDDMMRPDMISRLYDAVSKGFKLAMCDYEPFVDGEAVPETMTMGYNKQEVSELSAESCVGDFISGWPDGNFHKRFMLGVLWTKMYHKSVLEGLSFSPALSRHVDQPLSMDVLLRVDKVAYVPERLYLYRHRRGSVSHIVTADKNLDFLRSSFLTFEKIRSTRKTEWSSFIRALYKQMLIHSKDCPDKEDRKVSRAVCDDLISKSRRDYYRNRMVPVHEKAFFTVCWKFPWVYSLFQKVWSLFPHKPAKLW